MKVLAPARDVGLSCGTAKLLNAVHVTPGGQLSTQKKTGSQ
jgi:hypothetical protein